MFTQRSEIPSPQEEQEGGAMCKRKDPKRLTGEGDDQRASFFDYTRGAYRTWEKEGEDSDSVMESLLELMNPDDPYPAVAVQWDGVVLVGRWIEECFQIMALTVREARKLTGYWGLTWEEIHWCTISDLMPDEEGRAA